MVTCSFEDKKIENSANSALSFAISAVNGFILLIKK
jgi:hypothetical protein